MEDLIDITREYLNELGYTDDKGCTPLYVYADPPEWRIADKDGANWVTIDLYDPNSFEKLEEVLKEVLDCRKFVTITPRLRIDGMTGPTGVTGHTGDCGPTGPTGFTGRRTRWPRAHHVHVKGPKWTI